MSNESTDQEQGEVVEAHVTDGRIQYTAEYPDGTRVTGVMSKHISPHTTLSDSALEDLADDLVGTSIDALPDNMRNDRDTPDTDRCNICGESTIEPVCRTCRELIYRRTFRDDPADRALQERSLRSDMTRRNQQ